MSVLIHVRLRQTASVGLLATPNIGLASPNSTIHDLLVRNRVGHRWRLSDCVNGGWVTFMPRYWMPLELRHRDDVELAAVL